MRRDQLCHDRITCLSEQDCRLFEDHAGTLGEREQPRRCWVEDPSNRQRDEARRQLSQGDVDVGGGDKRQQPMIFGNRAPDRSKQPCIEPHPMKNP